jgi:pilus assembly protein Flp/PilA
MSSIRKMFMRGKKEEGASMVEYALLLVLIAIIAFAAVQVVGTEVSTAFSSGASAVG